MLVYTDTSVFGGCFDKEFKEWSLILFDEFRAGSKYLQLSVLTLEELEYAYEPVQLLAKEFREAEIEIIGLNDETRILAETYIKEGALTNKSYNDALHIALATLNNADSLGKLEF